MGLMNIFGPSEKAYKATDKPFVCSECESEYDTKEEAEQCCATEEITEEETERNTNDDEKPKNTWREYKSPPAEIKKGSMFKKLFGKRD